MSQNKTVIQGLEPEGNGGRGGRASMGAAPDFYSRGNQPSSSRGTVVPGMMEAQEGQTGYNGQPEVQSAPRRQAPKPGRPIVGFLYSISRTSMGEYWPLQVGRNTIGKDSSNDIQLAEGTVSDSHAVIVTRIVKSGVIAAITDAQSTNGTMINGETIGFTAEECHNGDVITIGSNYQCVLILIDAGKLGLSTSKDFIPVNVEEDDDFIPPFDPNGTRPGGGGFDPYSSGPASWGSGSVPAGGTVGLDGSTAGSNRGGTVSL